MADLLKLGIDGKIGLGALLGKTEEMQFISELLPVCSTRE